MQQNITESAVASFNTKGHTPTWYRDRLTPLSVPASAGPIRVGHSRTPAKRVFIGSGEDCMMDELNNLITLEEEACTS